MDEQVRFPCQLVHPGLFPLFRRDPPKLPVTATLSADALAFVSSPDGKPHTLATERLEDIREVLVLDLSGAGQRRAILKNSLRRMALVGGVGLVAVLLVRPYNLGISALIAGVAAATSGLMNFVLNGGLGAKRDLARFRFALRTDGAPFAIEVEAAAKQEVWQTLQNAGLTVVEQAD